MSGILETDDDRRRKRLRFRAWHRGIRENDLVLGPFADAFVGTLETQELDDFEDLLGVPDHDLNSWFTGRSEPPERFNRSLIERIRSHTQRPTA